MKTFSMDLKRIAGYAGLFLLVSAFMFGCAKSVGSTLDSANLISGWYSKEGNSKEANNRWIAGEADADFLVGPKEELIIRGSVPFDIYEKVYKKNIKLEVLVNAKHVATIELQDGAFMRKVSISSVAKKGDVVELVLKLNKSFIPKNIGFSPDERELGIIINDVIIR